VALFLLELVRRYDRPIRIELGLAIAVIIPAFPKLRLPDPEPASLPRLLLTDAPIDLCLSSETIRPIA
jgi:hypothetical protein